METTIESPSVAKKKIRYHLLTGAEAAATAMQQVNPDVVSVYPITPQTPIIQTFSKYVANGKATTEIINVESEHSAMSAAVGAATAGARTMTATASQGLALMIEVVYIASSMRLPIVMAIGNRALSGPINIHCDHSDSMLARDSGAVQIFVENAQEAYDFMVMASRLAEHEKVLLPVMICQDGFTITHTAEPVLTLDDNIVKDFVGDYQIPYPLLNLDKVTTQGPFDMPDYYFEHKRQQQEAMEAFPDALEKITEEYAKITNRSYSALDTYKLNDAERAIVALGSTAGTVKDIVDDLREKGEKVGVLKIRSFRPFPDQKVREILSSLKSVAVFDRAMSFGSHGPLFSEVSRSLYGTDTKLSNYIYGLGGRDLFPKDIIKVFEELKQPSPQNDMNYIGLRS
ncbi:MAG TPA: transketolase C-terminal domain-containing protein [Balneolales bacterium]|nr:transketolase C-terminal domain-containing protein [Balneolales bacterium]